MKLKLSSKNPRIVIDEDTGEELFYYTGFYLKDLQLIINKINGKEEPDHI